MIGSRERLGSKLRASYTLLAACDTGEGEGEMEGEGWRGGGWGTAPKGRRREWGTGWG